MLAATSTVPHLSIMANRLPVTAARDWQGTPPDPLDTPELYDGVLWRRPLAHFLDLLLLGIVAFVGWMLLSVVSALSFGLFAPLQVMVMALLPAIYAAVTMDWFGGTPGMRVMGLLVCDWNGRRIRLAQGFLMAILFYATVAMTSWLILIIALFNDRRRTLHDFVAGTVVVRTAHAGKLATTA